MVPTGSERFYVRYGNRKRCDVMDRARPELVILHARPQGVAETVAIVLNDFDQSGEFRLPYKDWGPIAITEYAEWGRK